MKKHKEVIINILNELVCDESGFGDFFKQTLFDSKAS